MQIMFADCAIELFKKCVLIQVVHKVKVYFKLSCLDTEAYNYLNILKSQNVVILFLLKISKNSKKIITIFFNSCFNTLKNNI